MQNILLAWIKKTESFVISWPCRSFWQFDGRPKHKNKNKSNSPCAEIMFALRLTAILFVLHLYSASSLLPYPALNRLAPANGTLCKWSTRRATSRATAIHVNSSDHLRGLYVFHANHHPQSSTSTRVGGGGGTITGISSLPPPHAARLPLRDSNSVCWQSKVMVANSITMQIAAGQITTNT